MTPEHLRDASHREVRHLGPNTCLGRRCSMPTSGGAEVQADREVSAAFRTDIFNLGNTPHHSLGNTSINSGTFMQALGIINTGLEGIEQRAFRFSLKVSF